MRNNIPEIPLDVSTGDSLTARQTLTPTCAFDATYLDSVCQQGLGRFAFLDVAKSHGGRLHGSAPARTALRPSFQFYASASTASDLPSIARPTRHAHRDRLFGMLSVEAFHSNYSVFDLCIQDLK